MQFLEKSQQPCDISGLMSELLDKYPAIEDLKQRAKKRLPHFVWEQLASGTGRDCAVMRNRSALDNISLFPRLTRQRVSPLLETELFGEEYDVPFGIAPIGTTGLFWPDGEHILARTAAQNNLPYCLSSVACQTPESVGPLTKGRGWFQLYPPLNHSVRDDLLKRASDSGFTALVVTVDVPAYGMRERPRRAGLRPPPYHLNAQTICQILARPHWAAATIRYGSPRFRTLEPYLSNGSAAQAADFVLTKLLRNVDEAYIASLRDLWPGPLLLKGILHPADARFAVTQGVDGIIVSNHGGRQFDGAPAAIKALPDIVEAVKGKTRIIVDSGIESGLDIVKAIAFGADFVMLGRAFIYGIAALGEQGGKHVFSILRQDLENNMLQMNVGDINSLHELKNNL